MADNRFFPKFKLEFVPMPGARNTAALAATLTSLVPIDRNFYEADVQVAMRFGVEGNTFNVTVAGLSKLLYDAIKVNKTSLKISLGYYLNKVELVFEGVVQSKDAEAGACFYETKLSGVEKAFHMLDKKCFGRGDITYAENRDIMDILEDIKRQTNVPLETHGAVRGREETKIARRWSFEEKSALEALREVHRRVRQIDSYSLLIRDSKIWYGQRQGNNNNAGNLIDTIYSHDNFLAETKPVNEDQGNPRGACDANDEEPEPIGYDFVMLGDPRLRPGDTVKFKIKEEGVEPVPFTIESITHDFSRTNGYRCRGRALRAETFLTNVLRARAPSAAAVAEEIDNQRVRNQERNPAVHVGDITNYTAGEHLADAKFGLQFQPTMTSPSVQVELGTEGFTLERRPMVAPFAWNLCGLVVPVYNGMRAVAVHNRYLREDALISGFIWTEEMTPPPNEVGDYWLCLPLNVPSDRAPNDSDKAANDLIANDGKRVIQLKGLRITVGEGLLPNLGTRPSNLGADNELQIEHSSGAKITMKENEIEMEAGGRTVNISGGKVKIS